MGDTELSFYMKLFACLPARRSVERSYAVLNAVLLLSIFSRSLISSTDVNLILKIFGIPGSHTVCL